MVQPTSNATSSASRPSTWTCVLPPLHRRPGPRSSPPLAAWPPILVWQARLDLAPLALTDEAPPHRCLATPARPGYHGNWLSTAPRLQADQDSTPSATTCTSTAPARLTMLVTMARVLGFVVQPVDEGPVDLQFFDGAPPGGPSITRAASASSRPLNSGRPPPISDSGPGQATSSSVTTVSRFSGKARSTTPPA